MLANSGPGGLLTYLVPCLCKTSVPGELLNIKTIAMNCIFVVFTTLIFFRDILIVVVELRFVPLFCIEIKHNCRVQAVSRRRFRILLSVPCFTNHGTHVHGSRST